MNCASVSDMTDRVLINDAIGYGTTLCFTSTAAIMQLSQIITKAIMERKSVRYKDRSK